ncbi:MAG: hypothetical protein HY363_03770 [Candidatus Aenigmarchaeota archaeon]|nr:hypothetical protein [Candidatus Aenigmarchaeota archaeon]
MKCPQHRRDTTGTCVWCGKRLCPACVGKQDGKKLYCDKCAVSLAPFKIDDNGVKRVEQQVLNREEPWT